MIDENVAAIRMTGINHWFGSGEVKFQAIFNATLTIERGSFTILKGPSGSGKTTILTLMGGLRRVQDGSLNVLGQELCGADDRKKEALRRRFGFIFQAHNLHESLTARQNTLMGLQVHGSNGDVVKQEAAAAHILESLGLGKRLDFLPSQLSGGQKQRVAVARALVSNPEIVFADEPTAALDVEATANVVWMLKALGRSRGVTTVMVTHDARILEIADRVVDVIDGRLVSK